MKVLGSSRNQCGSCDEYFNSNAAFEFHRTGNHGVDRRCMTQEEMLSRGMSINYAGFWIKTVFNRTDLKKDEEGDDESSD